MQKLFLLIGFILSAFVIKAQSFTGAGGAVPGTSLTQTFFPVTVSGVGTINASYGLAQVCVTITHPYTEELEILLKAPDGTIVPLSIQNGGSGNNYTGTCFTATASTPVKFGTAPFSGSFLPEGYLGAVNNGQNANGVWNLVVQDRRTAANAGSVVNFTLSFTNAPAPQPPAFPTCTGNIPVGTDCANAPLVCDFNGKCGSTGISSPPATVQDWPGSGLDGPCFQLQNNTFVKFVASSTTASFSLWIPTHTTGGSYTNGGVQMLFFEGTCGSGAITPHGCYPHILPYSTAAIPLINLVSANGLTIGNTYYLMIDGFNGDNCTFSIAAAVGISILDITPSSATICQGQSVNLTASGGNNIFSWSPGTGLNTTSGATVAASPAITTIYTVTSTAASGCPNTKDVTVNVNALPVITNPAVPDTQRVCQNGSTIPFTVTATAGSGSISGYQWYINSITNTNTGGTLIPFATSATYTPSSSSTGSIYFYCKVTNSNGCSTNSNTSVLIISPLPTTPTASATIQPTCLAPSGTIAVTTPVGANIQYSNGGAYQASGTFTGLAPATYNITAKNVVTGCISNIKNVTINTLPAAPATPVASVTVQPTCLAPTGTIVITSPIGANIEYSVGGAYQAGTSFSGLTNGTAYNITAKDIVTGCISAVFPLSVNTIPGAPATPSASVNTQPNCTITTGTITVTAPVGATIEYSVGGTYQASGIFTGLTAGTAYSVTAKDNSSGCVSPPLPLTIGTIPAAPATPTASITTQPNCTVTTGTITVTAPVGATIQFSVGGAYQSSSTFTGLTPGTVYSVTAKDNSTGCISTALPLAIVTIPAAPALPTASINIQPNCTITTGTITVTAPVGASIEYNVGGAYQTSGIFTGLTAGTTYSVTAKDNSTGCVSAGLTLTIGTIPAAPALPTASITTQPNCIITTGTITVTAPVGANIVYSVGGAYQASGIFTGLIAGTPYSVTAKDNLTGCISAALPLTIGTIPAGLALPTASITTQPNCIITTGTITVTAPVGANIVYSVGGTYQTTNLFSGLTPGTAYSVTAKDNSTGCISAATNLIINNIITVATPTATVTVQPSCTISTGTITVTAPAGTSIEYSVGGAYQASGIFTGLTAGSFYSVTAKDNLSGCISAALPLAIGTIPAVLAIPTASITAQPNCTITTGTITITAPVGASIQYSLGVTYPYQAGRIFTNLTPGATYLVTAIDNLSGCVSAALPLTINAIPVTPQPSVTSPVTYCQNAVSAPLTATGNNLLWYDSLTGGNVLPGAPRPSTITAGNTFYYVTQTLNGCESNPRRAITVTVNAVSTAVSGFRYNPDTVCTNGNNTGPAYSLGFTNGGTFTATPAGLNINATTGNINLAGSTVGTYTVTYTYNTTGCVTGSNFSSPITVNAAVPTVTVFSYTSPVCKNASDPSPNKATGFTTGGSFTAGQGLAINSATGVVDVANSLPGNYQVTYNITALGCRLATSNFSFITIVDTTSPVTDFSYSPNNICISSPVNPVLTKMTGFTTGGIFSATPAGLSINSTTGTINIGLSVPGIYTIRYSVPSFICRLAGSYSTTLTIATYANPVTGFSYIGPVCKGDGTAIPVPVTGFFSGGVYSSTTGLNIDSNTGEIDLTQSIAGNYSIKYDVAQGICNPSGFSTATINILSQPVPPTVTTASICGPGIVNLSAAALGTLSWYTEPELLNKINVGSTYTTLVNNSTSFYITNTVGTCASEASILNATVSPIPAAPFLGNDTAICNTDKLILNASGAYTGYLWQDGSRQPTINVTATGTYKVIVSTGAGCETSSSIHINVLDNCDDIFFPTGFTPNGDLLNDKFGPLGNLFLVKKYSLKVFNRYGEIVFTSSNPYEKWDGSYRGKQNGSNNYVWVAAYIYNNRVIKTQKGNITIVK